MKQLTAILIISCSVYSLNVYCHFILHFVFLLSGASSLRDSEKQISELETILGSKVML